MLFWLSTLAQNIINCTHSHVTERHRIKMYFLYIRTFESPTTLIRQPPLYLNFNLSKNSKYSYSREFKENQKTKQVDKFLLA